MSCWVGGRSFGQQSVTHGETIFCSGTVRNHCKNLSVQSWALGRAVKVSVLGASVRAEGAGAAPKSALQAGFLTRFTATACVHCRVSSASEVKLQVRHRTVFFFWSILEVPQAWGTRWEVHTNGFHGAFNGNQIFFSQKCVTFGCTFYFTKIKVELSTFLRRWRVCLSFWNCILLHFLFSNAHNVNYSIWLSWRQWQNPRFLIQNKEKFKLNILLCFHFEAQIPGKLKNLKL